MPRKHNSPNPSLPTYDPDAGEDLVECQICGEEFPEDSEACTHCGAREIDGAWYRKDEEPPPPIPPLPKNLPDDPELRRRGQAVQMERVGWDEPCVTMHATCTWRADAGSDTMWEGWYGPVELVDVEPEDGCDYCDLPFGSPSKWGD